MSGLFKTTTIDNGSVAGFQVNEATYGIIVPIILGTSRQSANIIDHFDFTTFRHSQKSGKGGEVENVTYTYKAAVLLALCEGKIDGVSKVWVDSDSVTTLPKTGLTLFDGAIGQPIWSYTTSKDPWTLLKLFGSAINSDERLSHALPYSGLAYVAGYIDLNSSGGVKQYNFEIEGQLRSTGDGIDVNPGDAIAFILANLGLTADNIHDESLNKFKNFCRASDLFVTVALTDQSAAYEIVNNLCAMTNTIVFWSQSKLKFIPRCEEAITGNGVTYMPNYTPEYDLDADDILEDDDGNLVTWERTDNAETYNQITVEFTNRDNGYETETVDYQILADISKRGIRPMSTTTYHEIHTKARAEYVAQMLAMNNCYGRNTYKFKLGWSHCLLEPGDLVTLTDKATGLNKLLVMIENVSESEDGALECEGKYVPIGTYSPARYQTYPAERAQIDRYVDPGNINIPVIFDAPAEITSTGLETWIAVSGGENWGGCEIWISEDDVTYKNIGKIDRPARHGILTSELLAANSSIDPINTLEVQLLSGDLLSGSRTDAENLNTLCWVDDELLAYETASLVDNQKYNLHYLNRGAGNTAIVSHPVGSKFVRLDDAIFKYAFNKTEIGKKIFIKFTSFNTFGMSEQSLADVEEYEHTLTAQEPPNVSNIAIDENTYVLKDGTVLTDVLVSFSEPSYSILDHYDIYYDENNSGQWFYSGPAQSGKGYKIKAIKQAQTVKIKIVTVNKFTIESSGAISSSYTITGKSDPPPNVTNLMLVQDEYNRANIVLTWDAIGVAIAPDLRGYEVRLGSDWSTAKKINADIIIGNTFSYTAGENGGYNFLVKAIDNSGNYSDHAVSQSITAIIVPDAPADFYAEQYSQDRSIAMLSWTASPGKDIDGYQITVNGETYFTKELSFRYTLPGSRTYEFSIRAKTVAGQYSNAAYTTLAASIEPYDVTGFQAIQSASDRTKVTLMWDKPKDLDVSFFVIKKGASWDTGEIIGQRIAGTYLDIIVTAESEQTFWIKAVSVAGKESQNPANLKAIVNLNPDPISNIQINQNPNDKSIVNIAWVGIAESDLVGYQVKIGYAWDTAEALPLTQELRTTYNLTRSGELNVMIKAVNAAGYYSDEVSAHGYITLEPAEVSNLAAYQNGETVELYWDKPAEPDVTAYEIREGANFDQGSLVVSGVPQNGYVVKVDTERIYQYFVKAINRSGHYSKQATAVSVNVTNLPIKNIIKTYDEIALQNGTHSNTEFSESLINFSNIGGRWTDYPITRFSDVGGKMVLKLKQSDGKYLSNGIYTCKQIDVEKIITANITAQFRSTVIFKGSGSAVLQTRLSQDGITWSDWTDFKPAQYTFRFAEFRIVLGTTDSTKTPEVNQLIIRIDVPDKDIVQTVTVPAGGGTFNYSYSFYTPPVVTPTAIGEGLYAQLISKTKTYYTLKIKNQNNMDVGGQADVIIKGY